HLAPPEDFSAFGGSSSAGSSVIGTPQPRSESPDLALLGTSLPLPAPPSEPIQQLNGGSPGMPSTLGQRTFNGAAEMPEWMANVTGGFAKEISVLMQEMDDLRKEKQRLQMDVANLMRTLSEYSPGGQFAPAGWSIPPDHPASEPLDATQAPPTNPTDGVDQLLPRGPVKAGWRTIKPEPKKIQSRVVPVPVSAAHHQIQVGQRSNSNTSLKSMASSSVVGVGATYQHQPPRALPAPAPAPSVPPTPTHLVHHQSQAGETRYVTPPQVQVGGMKVPSWTNWRPGNRSVPLRAPVPQAPAAIPTLFGE
ncbi:hypothetical protein FRB90_009542, partial [Tulasnella sp. 427]